MLAGTMLEILPKDLLLNAPTRHSSLRDRLVRFKRATKAVNRSINMMKYSIALVLWERRLIPRIYTLMTTL
ncbi:hypothetical protein J5U21_00547 [Saccharolobus shibatae]|uniref:Uncharacterized protein n=2 Tax=Saccharolobus shibatae TaxID=2286 RepID=A0A8F5GV93_9CREN|nr:hypothetical protein J5U21_00547 [Saccharolobus shibatae]